MTLRLRYSPPPEGMLNHSQLSDFLKCRYRWHMGNVRRIERRTFHTPLDRGSAAHYGIAATLRVFSEDQPSTSLTKLVRAGRKAAHRWIDTAIEDRGGADHLNNDQRLLVEDLQDTVPSIMERLIRHFDFDRFRVVRFRGKPVIEREMQCPLPMWDGFHGTLDVALEERIKAKPIWLLDWKFRSSFTSEDDEDSNLQKICYQHLMAANGLPTEGTIMFQIKAETPSKPRINKDGSVNRSKIATDWETYRRAVIEAGEDPADYEDEMRPKLDEIEWFRETRVYRPMEKVERVWRAIVVPAAKEMRARREVIIRTGFGRMNCSGCWAKDLCHAELFGEDTEILLRTAFVDTRNPLPLLAMSPEDSEHFEVTFK